MICGEDRATRWWSHVHTPPRWCESDHSMVTGSFSDVRETRGRQSPTNVTERAALRRNLRLWPRSHNGGAKRCAGFPFHPAFKSARCSAWHEGCESQRDPATPFGTRKSVGYLGV